MPKAMSVRDVLAATPTAAIWINEPKNKEAREFVRTWGEMRDSGESDWGTRRVLTHLRAHFDFPFTSRDSIDAALKAARLRG